VWIPSSTTEILSPNAIALGNFDGVHLGHAKVLSQIIEVSGTNKEENRLYPTVVSFSPHPREFFSGQRQLLLTTLEEKVEQLEKLGIEQLVLLPFDQDLAQLSPQEFVAKILVQDLNARKITVGQDFRFGYQRQGTAQDLAAIAAQFNVEVVITPLKTEQEQRISSSLIRTALAEGRIKQANQMLGRPYSLKGMVIDGQKLGRTLGFPTANLQLPDYKLLPRLGVYAVRVSIQNSAHRSLGGVMNIGHRPTLGQNQVIAEVNLFNWSEDLYQLTLTVQLWDFLRPEQKFSSLDGLKSQISQDCQQAQEILSE
jgi:riboflavin kinase/FMN adenylyltransferase